MSIFPRTFVVRMASLSNTSGKELASNAEAVGNIYRPVATETVALSALQHTRRKAASIPSFADGKLYE